MTSNVPVGGLAGHSVFCPAGKKVVGGGFGLVSAAGYAEESSPATAGTGWHVSVRKTGGAAPWGLVVYAICVTALP
jgi:hypothetical protein